MTRQAASPSRSRWRRARLAAVALIALGAIAGARITMERRARAREDAAARAWGDEAPPAPRSRAEPNESALLLERDARRIGLELAPRGSARAQPPQPPDVLALVHAALLASALQGRALADVAPDLESFLQGHDADLRALAEGAAARPAPSWETPPGRRGVRVPPPEHRADAFLVEAARLELRDPAVRLETGDAHLARCGLPRPSSLVLLDEILVLDALRRARKGDPEGASASMRAADRLVEALLAEPDAFTLGLAVHLSRLHAAALRQAGASGPAPAILGLSFFDLSLQALRGEAADLEAHAADGPPVARHVFSPGNRSSAAVLRLAVKEIIDAHRRAPCDWQSRASWERALASAPWWDPAAAGYLANLADLPRRAARADVDAALTRAVLDIREGRQIRVEGPCPGGRIVEASAAGTPVLRYEGPVPAVAVPMPFDVPLESATAGGTAPSVR